MGFAKRGVLKGIVLAISLAAGNSMAEVVAIVSPENPVDSLSEYELVNIFFGRSHYFPDGKRAEPVDQKENSPARQEFYNRYANKSAAQVKAYWARMIFTGRAQPPREIDGDLKVKQWVATHPGAIGYVERAAADDSVRILRTE